MDINRVARGPALERAAFIMMATLIGRFWAAGHFFVATSIAGALLLGRFERGDAHRIGAGGAHNSIRPLHLEAPTRQPRSRQSFLYFRVL
jgi:hypothetical protein